MTLSKKYHTVITLHHFTHPIWFEELGAFEKKENLDYFINFCEYAFENLKDLVPIWCTINEPSVFVAQGYFNGFSSGKKGSRPGCYSYGKSFKCHTRVYWHLKGLMVGMKQKLDL